MHSNTRDAARQLLAYGYSVFPVRAKNQPTVKWGQFRDRFPTEKEIATWFRNGSDSGIGLVCGPCLREDEAGLNIEVLDIDDGSLIKPFEAEIQKRCPGLLSRLVRVQSPRKGGGRHYGYLFEGKPEPGRKLAVKLGSDGQLVVLIETRGSGHYVVAPGSPGSVHPTGKRYRYLDGPHYEQIDQISAKERDILLEVAGDFSETIIADPGSSGHDSVELDLSRPGDDFDVNGPDWSEILEPYGWQVRNRAGSVTYWTRPGKDVENGHSATTGFVTRSGRELLCVHSTNAPPFEAGGLYDKFGTWARLNHDGDLSDAAAAIARAGYGEQPTISATSVNKVTTRKSSAPIDADKAAYHGPIGDLAEAYRGQTEAHPIAILVMGLCGAGNCIGRNPFFRVGRTKHYTIENAMVVGSSSYGRKGTAQDCADDVFRDVDPEWVEYNRLTSLSSGEGLVDAVRDAKGDDPGIVDKRLWVVSTEMSEIFRVLQRDGSTLSPKLRAAYDGKSLHVQTRKSPLHATDPHISVCGHAPQDELIKLLRNNPELTNGFCNRFLVVWTYRYCQLPDGGHPDGAEIERIVRRLKEVIGVATNVGQMVRDEQASKLWRAIYADLNQELPGIRGTFLARGPCHCLRLSMLYALLDGSATIRKVHLEAALAIWRYVEQSVAFIFGDSTGDKIADNILQAIRQEPGVSRTDISNALNRNVAAVEITDCLQRLMEWNMVREEIEKDDRGYETVTYHSVWG